MVILKSLYIDGNVWYCNCEMNVLKKWINIKGVVICDLLKKLENWNFMFILDSDMLCILLYNVICDRILIIVNEMELICINCWFNGGDLWFYFIWNKLSGEEFLVKNLMNFFYIVFMDGSLLILLFVESDFGDWMLMVMNIYGNDIKVVVYIEVRIIIIIIIIIMIISIIIIIILIIIIMIVFMIIMIIFIIIFMIIIIMIMIL